MPNDHLEFNSCTLFDKCPLCIFVLDLSEVKKYFEKLPKSNSAIVKEILTNQTELPHLKNLIKVRNVNERSIHFFKAVSKEELKEQFLNFVCIKDFSLLVKLFETLLEKKNFFETEEMIYTFIGEEKQVKINVVIPDEYQENWEGCFLSFMDLSDLHKARINYEKTLELSGKIFDNLLDAIFIVDAETVRMIDCNIASEKIFGYSKNEMFGRKTDLLHTSSESRQRFGQELANQVKEKGYGKFDNFPMKRKNGQIFPTDHSAVPIYNEEGEIYLWISVIRDITNQKRTEEKLKREKQMTDKFLSVARAIILVIGSDKKIRLINKKGCEIFGYKESEMLGKNFFKEFIAPEKQEKVINAYEKYITKKSEIAEYLEYPILTKENNQRIIAWYTDTINDNGEILIISSGYDITDMRQMEQALAYSEARYRTLVELSPEGIAVSKLDKFIFVNDAVVKILGMKNKYDIIGRSILDFVHPADQETIHKKINNFASGKPSPISEEKIIRPDGTIRYVKITGTPIEYGETTATLLVFRDVTDQKLAENEIKQLNEELEKRVLDRTNQLEAANEELRATNEDLSNAFTQLEKTNLELANEKVKAEKANLLKTEFISSVSHELRTPLNAIINFTNLLKKGFYDKSETGNISKLNNRQIEKLNTVYNCSENLLNLINDLLDLNKLQANKMPVHYEYFLVGEIILSVASKISIAYLKEKTHKVSLETVYENNPVIYCDKMRFEQIITNLLSNAAKFTNEGYIKISVKSLNDSKVQIIVEDTGIGIREDDLKDIFNEFYQIERLESRQYKGTGLGLPIVKKLVEILGGSISVSSQINVGTEFIIELPTKKPKAKP